MISEVDIRDWDKVDFKSVDNTLRDLAWSLSPRQWDTISDFIEQVVAIRNKQLAKVPRLYLKGFDPN